MANSVSFFIRAIDLTKQGVGSAKAQLEGLVKVAGGKKLLGLFGKGLWAAAAVIAAKTVSKWADDIKSGSEDAFGAFEKRGARAFSKVTSYFSVLGGEFKKTIVGGLGKTLEVLGLSSGESGTGISAEQKAAEDVKREKLALTKAEMGGNQTLLAYKEAQLQATWKELAADRHNLDLQQKELDLTKEIKELGEKIADDRAKAAEAALKEYNEKKAAAQELADIEADRIEKERKEKAQEKQRMAGRAIDILAARAQGAGNSIFVGGRRISNAASSAMGARIDALRGDDPAKYQRDSSITLGRILKLLGG